MNFKLWSFNLIRDTEVLCQFASDEKFFSPAICSLIPVTSGLNVEPCSLTLTTTTDITKRVCEHVVLIFLHSDGLKVSDLNLQDKTFY